jgi:glycosyltransferase involved in cell wall biosynthesis
VKVVFFHRKPHPTGNFSVEILFKQVRNALPARIDWEVKELKFRSLGFLKRLYICIEAALSQKGINHITGDIHFIAILLRKKRTVLTVLDVGFMKHPNRLARLVLKWLWIILPVKRSAVITTISHSTKTELLKFVKVAPSRVFVIHVPISEQFIPKPKVFNKAEPRILQVGTAPNKNVAMLVRALKGIPCILEIVGVVNEELTIQLSESGVKFTSSNNLSNQEILEKYNSADIISLISTYEGFGMPIVEGNAVGRVVITSNILSMPEVAGDSAHLVNPFEVISIRTGILRIIEDDAYREKLIRNGFENRKRFDASEIANRYVEIYDSIER